jgi:magnesium chelatase subunit I
VSARVSISLVENVLSNMERRGIVHGEKTVCPRIADLHAALTAITGKIELVYEGEQEGPAIVARKLIGEAVKSLFGRYFPEPEAEDKESSPYGPVLGWFGEGRTVEIGDELSGAEYRSRLGGVRDLERITRELMSDLEEREVALVMELLLEGLHQHSMVSKQDGEGSRVYKDMLTAMFDRMAEE